MSKAARWQLIGVTWLAAFLRMPGLFANSFHADEALFASFARWIHPVMDPLLQTQPVDKPPLLFYLQAAFFSLFGPEQFAARLPNWIASLLLVPMVAVLAWRLFKEGRTAVLTALLLTLSPLAIQFSPTAFLDPLLTGWLAASLLTLHRSKAGWAGFLFGLAAVTKYQALLFLPLVIGLAVLWHFKQGWWRRWLVGFLPVSALLFLWDSLRVGNSTLWSTQISNYGGIRLSRSWELWPRARDWLALWRMGIGGVAWIGGLLLLLLLIAGILLWRNQTESALTPQLLLLFVLSYAGLHWLLAIPVWDRYLLPLLPLLAIVTGCQLAAARYPRVVVGLVVLLLLPGAWGARNGRFPIGGQPNADQGATLVAAALSDAPYGTVLYDHWYSWQWRYHLFNEKVYASWFNHPADLAQELAVFGVDGNRHYLVLPHSDAALPVIRTVAVAGFDLNPVALAAPAQMQLYEIMP